MNVESSFFKYFAMNFNSFVKKLVEICYAPSPNVYTQLNLFGDERRKDVYKATSACV
jgi:hypothetical protein